MLQIVLVSSQRRVSGVADWESRKCYKQLRVFTQVEETSDECSPQQE